MEALERENLRNEVAAAARPAAQIWPLGTFAYRNPIRGYEDLPFDEGVRTGSSLLGGRGFLSNREYRKLFRRGRITKENLLSALVRVGPGLPQRSVEVGGWLVVPRTVLLEHIVKGIDEMDPHVLEWTAREDGTTALLETARRIAADIERPDTPPVAASDLPGQRTLSDWLEDLTGVTVVDAINREMVKWSAAFLDEGLAGWGMPSRSDGFYLSWRGLASKDRTARFMGIKSARAKIEALPDSPEDAIEQSMLRLDVPRERWPEYFSRMFAQLPGWTGFARWRSENPEYPGQREHPIDLTAYLAVRLFYEVEFVQAISERELGVDGTLSALREREASREAMSGSAHWRDACASKLYRLARCLTFGTELLPQLTPREAREMLGWLDYFPTSAHGPVWLEAYEDSFRQRFVKRLAAHLPGREPSDSRPAAQLIFCIDARSEPFRRHLESRGAYETFGYAGFFGVPISHQAFDSEQRLALCPVLLKPPRAVDEAVRGGEEGALVRYASGSRWRGLVDRLFHDVKQHPGSAFALVDAVGFLFTVGLIGRTFFQRAYASVLNAVRGRFLSGVKTRVSASPGQGAAGLPEGFSLEEQAAFVEGGLRIIGLTDRLARLVVVCGHGALSQNNPYAAAYNCGACGGAHGDPNARLFASMANDPQVRKVIAANGISIPDDTWFLPAKHDTTTDRVSFYDATDVPASHSDDLRCLQRDLAAAGATQTAERLPKLPRTPRALPASRAWLHALSRSVDWANPRPEWGLSSNAAFLIGRRCLTEGLNLESRVFLHSYDPAPDTQGAILEKIMTAPLVVGEWINMEYYFSSVAPWVHGSGSKVIHNVVGGVGVMLGSQGDLQGGLPLQGVMAGMHRYHEPMRLLAVIEAPRERISALIRKHEVLQRLFCNQWMNLLALDPETHQIHRFNPDSSWEGLPAAQAA